MIKSFRHKGLEKFFLHGTKKGIQPKHAEKLADILDLLDASSEIKDMNFPGSDLHSLKGDLRGFWSVRSQATGALFFDTRKMMHLTWITLTTIKGRARWKEGKGRQAILVVS